MLVLIDVIACVILYATVPLNTELSLLQCTPTVTVAVNSRLLFVTPPNKYLTTPSVKSNRVGFLNQRDNIAPNNPTVVSVRIPGKLLDLGRLRKSWFRNESKTILNSQKNWQLLETLRRTKIEVDSDTVSVMPTTTTNNKLRIQRLPLVRAVPLVLSKYGKTASLYAHAWIWITAHLNESLLGTRHQLIDLDDVLGQNVQTHGNSHAVITRSCRHVIDLVPNRLEDDHRIQFERKSFSVVACNSLKHPSSGFPSLLYTLTGTPNAECSSRPGGTSVTKQTTTLPLISKRRRSSQGQAKLTGSQERQCPTPSQVIVIPETLNALNYGNFIDQQIVGFQPASLIEAAYGVLLIQTHSVRFVYSRDMVDNVTICYRSSTTNESLHLHSNMVYLSPTLETPLFYNRLVVAEFDTLKAVALRSESRTNSNSQGDGGDIPLIDHISYTLSSGFLVGTQINVRCKVSDLNVSWQETNEGVVVFRDNIGSHSGCLLIPISQ